MLASTSALFPQFSQGLELFLMNMPSSFRKKYMFFCERSILYIKKRNTDCFTDYVYVRFIIFYFEKRKRIILW